MGDESSEQEGFSDIMSEEGKKKPATKSNGTKKVHFTEDDEEDALDEDDENDEYGDEEEGEGEMEEDGEEGMED
jgi:hypothetical protein